MKQTVGSKLSAEGERSHSVHAARRQFSLLIWLLLAGLSTRAAQTDKQAWCAQYATRAVQQNQLLTSHPTCRVIPSLRWQPAYNNHYSGCMSFPQSFMESEQRARDEQLRRCGIALDSPSALPQIPDSTPVSPNSAESAAAPAVAISTRPSLPGLAHRLRILHTFSAPDGSAPVGALIEAPDGSFYGITSHDGQLNGGNNAHSGTVFKIALSGSYSTLHVFSRGPDGGEPTSLILATDGNLYGTTREGGALNGTVFKMTPAGVLTTLHSFNGTDGSHPLGLVQDRAGVLYGSTLSATIFKITMSGEFSNLPLSGVNDCSNAALTPSPDGFLYAICAGGGAGFSGEIIKLSTGGNAVQLHAFAGPDGRFPRSPLTLAKDGNFYGATTSGGQNGLGTLFKISPQGAMTLIRHLSRADGAYGASTSPAMLALPNGDLVGAGSSTIFELAPDGALTTLYQLNNQNGEGMSPNAFVQGRDGGLYASTNKGGGNGMGAVLQLAVAKAGEPVVAGSTQGNDSHPRTQKLMALDVLRTAGREPGKFYLGGIWVVHARVASGQIIDTQYRFAQAGDEFHYCFKEAEMERCYIGSYPARATKILLKPEFKPPPDFSIEQVTMVVKDPDHVDAHVLAEGHELVLLYERLSAPESDDAACDPQNSSHTAANFAFERARASYHRNDTAAAACWNHAAAAQGYARSQGLLSAVLEVGEGVAADYSASYAWARKAAEQGDFLGEIMLSRLYHFGHGIAADEVQSKVWRDKGMTGYRSYLQSMQGKGSPWERLSPAQRSKVVRLTFAILDTWAGSNQQSALLDDVKHAHPGISDDAARAMLRDDPDYQDARDMSSSGFDTQLRMVLGLDTADKGTSK